LPDRSYYSVGNGRTQDLRDIAPHYVVVLVRPFLAVAALRAVLGETRLLLEFGVVVAFVFVYPSVVKRIECAPEAWE